MKKLTNWTQATRNPFKAIKKLISCLRYEYVAWLGYNQRSNCY